MYIQVNSSQGQPMQNCSQRWQPEQTVHVSCDVRGIDTDPFLGPQCSATRAFDRFCTATSLLFGPFCSVTGGVETTHQKRRNHPTFPLLNPSLVSGLDVWHPRA